MRTLLKISVVMLFGVSGFFTYNMVHADEEPGTPAILKSACDNSARHKSVTGRKICTCLAEKTKTKPSLRAEFLWHLNDNEGGASEKKSLSSDADKILRQCSLKSSDYPEKMKA